MVSDFSDVPKVTMKVPPVTANINTSHKHISDTNKDITSVESENLRTVSKSVAHLSNRRRKQSMAVFAALALHLCHFLSFILSL